MSEVEPTFLGLNPGGWVALAMLTVFAILIWKKVPGAIARALDSKIALIRDQLAEAETLRKEAEALKGEYEAKAASADKDREALLERAKHEADEIVAKAKTDAEALIGRRTRMAEDKITAEERAEQRFVLQPPRGTPVAGPPVGPAEILQVIGAPTPVADGLVQAQRLLQRRARPLG